LNNNTKYLLILSILLLVILLLKKIKPNILTPNIKSIKKPYKPKMQSTWDLSSQKNIDTLHPLIKQNAINFINDAEKQGYLLRVTDGYRSIEEQNKKYAQGRTEGIKGHIITKAVGGNSLHNYRLAIDIIEIKNKKALWVNPNWDKIGAIGKKYGFVWGGDWTMEKEGIVDKPHFENRFGKTLAQIKKLDTQKVGDYINLT